MPAARRLWRYISAWHDGDYEFDGINGRIGIVDSERIVVLVNQCQPFFDVFESDARSTRPGFFVTAVADDGRYRIIPVADSDLDERGVVITYSVLERVFDECDQQQGRDGHFIRDRVRIVETDVDAAVVADAHQLDVVLDELDVLFERYGFAARFVENVPHHLGQFDDGAFRVFGIYVDQGVDIVERIHEEMGVDLVSQIIHFRLQVLTF